MSARSTYLFQIQVCNVLLIIFGLTAVALAGSQFSSASLGNFRKIDFRLLNWVFVLNGLVGLYSLAQNRSTAVAKTLYCVSIVIGIYSTAFYSLTLYRVVRIWYAVQNVADSADIMLIGNYLPTDDWTGKIVVASLMIAVAVLATVAALIAAIVLDQFAVVTQPTWPTYSQDQEKKYRMSRMRLTSLAAIKLFTALCTLGLAIFYEYQHELISGDDRFVVIGTDHIAALFAITSAVVDLHAAMMNKHPSTNFKVSIGMAIITAVWCLKTVEIIILPFYRNDLQVNRIHAQNLIGLPTDPANSIIIIGGILLGLFSILFVLNFLTAILSAKCIHYEFYCEKSIVERNIAMESRCLGLMHLLWSLGLMALVVLSLISATWNVHYYGSRLLWLAVLTFCTGFAFIAHNKYASSLLTAQLVLGIVCFTCSVEEMCSSVNLVYQSATFKSFSLGIYDAYLGNIILTSVQLAILAAEALTAFFSVIVCGKAIVQRHRVIPKHSACVHLILFIGNIFYGAIMVGCYVTFELGYWRYSQVPIEVPFYRMGNGLLVFGVGVMQAVSVCYPALLFAATALNIVAGSIALFVLSYCITNTYYLSVLLGISTGDVQWVITEVALILAATATLACVICTFCATFLVLSSLHVMHYQPISRASTVVPYEENYGTLRTLVTPTQTQANKSTIQTPVRHMEEQSIYWSAEENPYYYQACKRYYDQPYKIDSGFYGYALVSPQMLESPYFMMSDTTGPQHNQIRSVNSAAAQTRIGHIFN